MRIVRAIVYGLVALSLTVAFGCGKSELVLYCAQDKEFAEGILDDYKKDSGVAVTPKFDTESTKSVSLVVEIEREKGRPRCDVFWNNEIVSTIRLEKEGLLLPYDSPSAKPYPEWARAKNHTWHAFATRARVILVNTDKVAEKDWPRSLRDLSDAKWRNRAVMAKPQFGTSATQAACLFAVMGPEKAKEYYRSLKVNGIHLAPGNKQAAEWVADGKTADGEPCVVGLTDTDDAMEQIVKEKKHVKMIFPDRDAPKDDKFGTLFIPNTLAIIKDSRNPEQAKKLVDYLLSAKIEEKLATGDSYQLPLNPEVKVKLPEQMVMPSAVKNMDVDFYKAAELWDETQEFLRNEFGK